MATTKIKDVNLKIGTENQFQSKLKDLPINTLVGTTDPIQEGELDTSIITKLNKAENALPKPTNDTTGSAGQVLKKTANGSEWGDAPSGGGKLYKYVAQLKIEDYANFYYTFYDTKLLQKTDIPQYLNTHTKQCETVTTVVLSVERPNTLVLGFWCSVGATLLSCQTIENGVMTQTTPYIEALPTCEDLIVTEL